MRRHLQYYSTRWTRRIAVEDMEQHALAVADAVVGETGACDGPSVEDLFSSGEAVDRGTR